MGLHTGVAELRDGDYFGTSLNRTARIMSAAHGEQVLLSAATAEALGGQLPEGVTLREMGEHRLKGLLNPERLLQVVGPDLRRVSAAGVTHGSQPACRARRLRWPSTNPWPSWHDVFAAAHASFRYSASVAPARRGSLPVSVGIARGIRRRSLVL
jgi:hypothetical protein